VKSAPVFGVGYNNYGAASVREGVRREKDLLGHSGQGSDSSLLNTWATTGVVGLAALLVFLWSVFAAGLKMKRPDIEGVSLLYFGFTAAFIAILVDSFLINALYYAPLLIVWVVFAGLFADQAQVTT
jgi:O-antigen ligase